MKIFGFNLQRFDEEINNEIDGEFITGTYGSDYVKNYGYQVAVSVGAGYDSVWNEGGGCRDRRWRG